MTNARYNELSLRLRAETEESGVKLDLNCPCDRAILSECGLTPEETFEFLALFDAMWDDGDDDTIRTTFSPPERSA